MVAIPPRLDPERLPEAADAKAAAIGLTRYAATAQGAAAARLAEPGPPQLIAALCGNSPFLAHILAAEGAFFDQVLADGADSVFANLLADLRRAHQSCASEADLMRDLRRARRRAALLIAMADLAGWWPLETVTGALSDLADTALETALAYLLDQRRQAGEIDLPDPASPTADSGLIVLGLGKLGARELNYSSDIDLIILYDRDRIVYRGRRSLQECCVRLARDLVRLLQEATADGYVFRVDLRLRPDPGSTPLALSTLAAEAYYEGMGQNWERAAMIKARAVAGDKAAGQRFLDRLRPFIWRKHLDFAAIADIHSIKRQIHAVKGHRQIAVAGHNIKLGRGGIREIEFFAQTQQLIWGGRRPGLRQRGTLPAIAALAAHGQCRPEIAEDLIAAYRYLRHVEHRLQMIDDHQTQTLPEDSGALERLAIFCGHRGIADFSGSLREHLGKVEDRYAELFEESPSLGNAEGSLVFTGTEDDPDTIRNLAAMGFPDPSAVAGAVRAWHHGRYRATRSARAREILTELMPRLLAALAASADPDTAFRRFDAFLQALPAGVQVFSLLQANPDLLGLIAEIMGTAPLLADNLARSPALLDGLLAAGNESRLPDRARLAADLDANLTLAADYQDALDLIRRWTKDRFFQIGVALLRGALDGDAAGPILADIADLAIGALSPRVRAEFQAQHGRLPGRDLAVIALGKLGSREMTITSDLDLIFIYDIPADRADWEKIASDGAKPLAPIQYFARLAQRIIAAIAARTGEGTLFEVDMRLRPSGNSGPIASGLDPFLRYQRNEAWTWEHMALTRARVICGDADFAAEIRSKIDGLLTMEREPTKLAQDCRDMRERIRSQHRGEDFWDIKYRPGGMVDLDFIAQYLLLCHGWAHPELAAGEPGAILAAAQATGLLDRETAEDLRAALRLWRRLLQISRLAIGGAIVEAELRPQIRRKLAESAGCADFAALKSEIERCAGLVAAAFARLISAT